MCKYMGILTYVDMLFFVYIALIYLTKIAIGVTISLNLFITKGKCYENKNFY